MATVREVLLLLLCGLLWGVTNPLIKRGSAIADAAPDRWLPVLGGALGSFGKLLFTWQWLLPFLVNQCGSLLFFVTLGATSLSLAVPVANASTFGFTALAAAALGEPTEPVRTSGGIALVTLGVYLTAGLPLPTLAAVL